MTTFEFDIVPGFLYEIGKKAEAEEQVVCAKMRSLEKALHSAEGYSSRVLTKEWDVLFQTLRELNALKTGVQTAQG